MKQLIFDSDFAKGERFPGESEFIIVENEEASRLLGDNHSSPDSLIFLGQEYIEALELFLLNNSAIAIKLIIEEKYRINFNMILSFLKENSLIVAYGENWMVAGLTCRSYRLSLHGLIILEKFEELKRMKKE